jgi:hypothetical protein
MNDKFHSSPPIVGEGGIENRLWSFIDGLSSSEERSAIEKLLESNYEWKNKYQELLEVHQLMRSAELEHPSMRFAKNVMEEIAKYHIAPATKNYINKKIIWGIALFFITLIVAFLVYSFGQIDWNAQGDTKLPFDISQIDYSKIFNNEFVNAFMMVNVLLGLILLDRLLSNKRKKFQKES